VLEGGTLTSSAGLVRAAACTAPSFGVARGTRWFGEGSVVGTLLGPEGADPAGRKGRGVGCLGVRAGSSVVPPGVVSSGGWRWRWEPVAGRTLRTAQWTRASFELWRECLVGPPRSSVVAVRWCGGRGGVLCGQVVKGTRWMPGHQEPMKDVGGCEKPRGAANRALIRGCPNGGTPHQSCGVTRA
jgi:hypothetical protein